ncbi:Small GTPase superfamily ARF type [Penicillium brevicompactum]|uniref:Signal recognition particle receptor subunit beta n=1 Tax=Penicillium brevicompactum TaxID=5074 RepID=A0A9W9UYT5_PENBR|nr:Small GTPase superfamily ARF type [Penicillium brevicompactum]
MSSQANWHSVTGIATLLFDGNLVAIAIAIAFTFGVPVLLHIIFFQAVASPPSSNFLLLGPSGAGKTAFTTLLEAKSSPASKKSHATHTSQQSTLATVTLPPTVPTGSNRYRSVNDPSLKEAIRNPIRYRVRDTPGHGKLRVSQGLAELSTMAQSKDIKTRLRGVLFMVDTAALVDETTLRDTATYLHDVLLVLQKRAKNGSSSKRTTEIPVLVAANKQDLFTALPPGSVREKLEAEIERIRKSKNKGLLDAADTGLEDEEEILANDEQETFTFKLLEFETGIKLEVVGGAVKGDQEEDFGSGVRRWEEWIGMCL